MPDERPGPHPPGSVAVPAPSAGADTAPADDGAATSVPVHPLGVPVHPLGVPVHPLGPAVHNGGAPDIWASAAGAGVPGRDRPGHRGRLIAVVALAVVLVAAGVGAVVALRSSSTTGPAAANRLVKASLAAANRAGTFHYVSVSTAQGVTQTTVGDAGPDSGRQYITIGTQSFTVLVVGKVAYFQGNALSMQDQLGLDPVASRQHAEQWISLQPSDAPYQSIYAAVTTASALSDSITIDAETQLAPTTLDGTRVTPIRGSLLPVGQTPTKGTAHYYVRATGSPLPVRFTGSGVISGQTSTFNTRFSRWGESVVVQVPAGALPYSSAAIGGLSPDGNVQILT